MFVYVIIGKSESCDEYGPIVKLKKPTKIYLKELKEKWDNSDLTITKVRVED